MDDAKLLKEELSNYERNHAETLMPMVHRVLLECGLKPDDLDAVAVTRGPGSFTGLRIGMATAKGICMAAGVALVGISTLEALAWNLNGSGSLICPMLDARKAEIYAALYRVDGDHPQLVQAEAAYSPNTLVQVINDKAAELNINQCTILGDAVEQYGDYFRTALGGLVRSAPRHLALPRAAALAELAGKKLSRGEVEDIFKMHPVYLRLSEAEIKRRKGEV